MKLAFLSRGSQWLPTVLVIAVIALAGGRLIVLSVQQRAAQMRATADELVGQYGHSIEKELQRLAERARTNGTRTELDQLLASLKLGGIIGAEYDFALSKVDATGTRPRTFVSTRVEPIDDAVTSRIHAPEGFSRDLPGGQLQLAIRPKGGWYPVRALVTSIALLAFVAWLLAFAMHDLVHSLHRSREALATSRRKLQDVNRRLTAEIEQRGTLQKSVEHSRYHDLFTGLPNRRYFMDQLDRALREVRTRRRGRLAVMLIEIDRFKLINETLGHTAGDELMVQVARRFEKATASIESILARWSSDQFAVLAFEVHSIDTALELATDLQQALIDPLDLRKHRLTIAARIGFTCVDSGLLRTEEALREADIALSVAQRHATSGAVGYEPAMAGSAASLVSLEADLHLALERRELLLLFQPIVDLHTHRAAGVEALLRWQHPVEGLLTPDKFLGVAEEAGLIVPITQWTIWRACRLASQWRERLPANQNFYLSVNVSAAALNDPGLSTYIAQVLRETGTPASELKLELTEGGLISNPGAAREILEELHDLGVEMMLDDFGTGYSSLSHLQLFPFDYVKIDRPLVGRAGSERANTAIATAIIQMAGSLGLKSVAEIVETSAAADELEHMGCDFAQGNWYCEPVPADEALQLLRKWDGSIPPIRSAAATLASVEDDSPTIMIPEDTLMMSEDTLILAGLRMDDDDAGDEARADR